MKTHDARLVPAALAGMVACHAVGTGLLQWRLVALVAVVVAVLSAVMATRVPRGTWLPRHLAVACALVGCVVAVLGAATGYRLETRVAPAAREAIAAGEEIVISGEVLAEARPAAPDAFTGEPRWHATVLASSVDGLPAHARVRIVVADVASLALGTPVRVVGHASDSRDPRDVAVMWDARVLAAGQPDRLSTVISGAREGLRQAAAGLPVEVRALTEGMVIGDDSRMDSAQLENMRRSGLAHLTAVSGAHFAVLTLVVVWALRRAKVRRAWQAVAVGVVSGAFTVLVGAEPSVVRAVTMAFAISLSLLWGRPARAVPALSAGVLVLLAIDPLVATSLGFQLSVVAVAAIAVWAPHLASRFARRMTPGLARVIAIPVAAAAATAPLLVGIAGGLGAYGVPANLVAAPFAGPVTVLGLVGTALAPASPAASEVLVAGAGVAAWPVAIAARAFSSAPGAWLDWPSEPWAGAAAAALVAVAVIATTSRRVRGWSASLVVGLVLVGLVAPQAIQAARAPRLPDWDIVVCDVGQGDMMLLRTEPHAAVVIDTGPRDGGATDCLARHGVRRVDLLILTHPHADHDGAAANLIRAVPISRAWVSPSGLEADSAHVLRAAGISVESVTAPRTAETGAVRLQVVAPTAGRFVSNDNDASVVVLAEASGARVLALGDLESAGQQALATALVAPVVVDVVKIAHHGSANQDPALAGMVTARIGAVSVGAGNAYGHPALATLELYGPRVGMLHRTDLCGDLLVAAGSTVRFASRCPSHVGG